MRAVPPHPCPLPQGEGDRCGTFLKGIVYAPGSLLKRIFSPEGRTARFGFRISDFFRASDFGFRISALAAVPLYLCLTLLCLLAPAAKGAEIPDRPEKLTFPPLAYEPPTPADYRVQLQAGPVAYVVPDRELPLVNVAIYLRAGEFLDPEGKDGLADTTGYLLARGGTASKTAEAMEERLAFLAAHLNSGDWGFAGQREPEPAFERP